MNKFFVFNTGCIRRSLDTIRIQNYLLANEWVYTSRVARADLIVILTCGAVSEGEDRGLVALRQTVARRSPDSRVIVSGCLPKINEGAIREIGDFEYVCTGEFDKFDELIGAKVPIESIPESNTITENVDVLNYTLAYRLFRHSKLLPLFHRFSMRRAFLRGAVMVSKGIEFIKGLKPSSAPRRIVPYYNITIANGCVGACSYCVIRNATGLLQSKPISEIMTEFKKGLREGHELIQLVCEDTGCYGIDAGLTIIDLLREMLKVEGDYQLIMIDFNPRWIVKYHDELLPILVEHKEKIRELFIPLQSGSQRIVDAMCRGYDVEKVKKCLLELKASQPRLKLRTTMIVGFPGETEEDFQLTQEFVREVKFFEVTLNTYEDRPGSASSEMAEKIPEETVRRRADELVKIC